MIVYIVLEEYIGKTILKVFQCKSDALEFIKSKRNSNNFRIEKQFVNPTILRGRDAEDFF